MDESWVVRHMGALILAAICLVSGAFVVFIYHFESRDRTPPPCAVYGGTPIRNVPARCVSHFTSGPVVP